MTVARAPAAALLPFLLAPAAAAQVPPPADPGALVVQVGNVRAGKGHVRIDLCPEARFLKDDCPFSASAPAAKGTTAVVLRGVPPGRYAVQAYLDENDNGRVDRALLGLPHEGIGFSRDPRILFSAPKFADCAFSYAGGAQAIRLSLRYFL